MPYASALPSGLRWALIAGLTVLSPIALAATKHGGPKKPQSVPQDRIDVVGRIALPAGSITGLAPTRHFSSDYLYAEYDAGKKVIIIDVTKPGQPSVVTDLEYPTNGAPGSIIAAAGTSALAFGAPSSSAAVASPTSVKIMSYADLEHPKVLREFSGVTAIGRDDSRALIFLADGAGVWILQEVPAEDPAVEAAYSNYVLYNR
jgi:hypothetical protein